MKYGTIIVSGSSNFTILLWAKALQFFGGKPHVSLEFVEQKLKQQKGVLCWPFKIWFRFQTVADWHAPEHALN